MQQLQNTINLIHNTIDDNELSIKLIDIKPSTNSLTP